MRGIEFLEPMSLSVVSERRETRPYGCEGGGPGVPGRNVLLRADGARLELAGRDEADAGPGDVLVVETPGGGGWGAPSSAPRSSSARA